MKPFTGSSFVLLIGVVILAITSFASVAIDHVSIAHVLSGFAAGVAVCFAAQQVN